MSHQLQYKVSVIITNYNQGHLIKRAILSINNQNYNHDLIELIIIDDGSTDDSITRIVEYVSDPSIIGNIKNIKTVFKKNGGTASARNAGIKESSNDIICFLDADDEYLPNKISKSVLEITRFPGIGCVYSDYNEVMTDGKINRAFKHPFEGQMLLKTCIVSTNSVISREAINRVGEFDETIGGCEDYDLWIRIAVSGLILRHIPEALFNYYNHGNNKTVYYDKNKWSKEEQLIKHRAINGQYYIKNV